jgi:hypothetical protein
MQPLSEEFIPLAPLLTKLGVMLTASLLVERFLTVINWLVDRLFIVRAASDWEGAKQVDVKFGITEQAVKEAKILAEPPDNPGDDSHDPREVEPNPLRKDIQSDSRFDVKEILPPERILNLDERSRVIREQNRIRKEFWLQILGMLVGIGGCMYMKFSVWFFISQGTSPQLWEFILTGIIIGAGSKPVNFLMNFLINRKIVVSREEIKEEEAKKATEEPTAIKPAEIDKSRVAMPAAVTVETRPKTVEDTVGFVYDGGDRPERLESTHFFKEPIDTIVYHHTAMHSDAPFREVVKEFDRKGWLTGYHCVILKDGTIRVLCRWDRFGNHAKGYNNHSMGLAVHGNFETNPEVPYSNYNGQYGIQHPTELQIDSTARIIALWAFLNSIKITFPEKGDVNFPKGIVPHRDLAPKACPGCNFPHQILQRRIGYYAKIWKDDKRFTEALNEFKTMNMAVA